MLKASAATSDTIKWKVKYPNSQWLTSLVMLFNGFRVSSWRRTKCIANRLLTQQKYVVWILSAHYPTQMHYPSGLSNCPQVFLQSNFQQGKDHRVYYPHVQKWEKKYWQKTKQRLTVLFLLDHKFHEVHWFSFSILNSPTPSPMTALLWQ